jgi:hypothetical protein
VIAIGLGRCSKAAVGARAPRSGAPTMIMPVVRKSADRVSGRRVRWASLQHPDPLESVGRMAWDLTFFSSFSFLVFLSICQYKMRPRLFDPGSPKTRPRLHWRSAPYLSFSSLVLLSAWRQFKLDSHLS